MAYRIARKKIALFCSAAGLATAGLTPTAALSQAASEEVASGDDLIVTANRRAEDVTKIPYNIAVLGGDQLAATGVNNLEDLSQQLPNLVVTSHGNQNLGAQRQVMRGLSASPADRLGQALEQNSVSTYLDNSPYANFFPIKDIQRVEVLRGPCPSSKHLAQIAA